MSGQIDIRPASIAQVQASADGRVYEISSESSSVAADLQALDAGLKVRFSEQGECYIIRHDWHPDCPHNGKMGPGGSYLVSTVEAHQAASGIWTGLDERVVARFREIDPHGRSGYDYAAELEKSAREAARRRKAQFAEKVGEAAERTAHALRKDLGERYKGQIFT